MTMRLFLELASRLTGHRNATEIIEEPETVIDDGDIIPISIYEGAAKFHIGMLTISLLVGLGYGGYVGYSYWMEKETVLVYVRNLLIALVCRTFFSILFDGVIILGSINNIGGGNALLAFEQISRGLVLAFWLTLTIYLHARVQRDFNSEPTLKLYQYGVPCVAVFFSFVWIFTLQDQHPNVPWWLVESVQVYSKWIVNAADLLFLLIQLGLVVDIVRMMMTKKSSLDNDSVSLFSRIGIVMGALVLIFWLQFGLVLGRIPFKNTNSYIYFDFFIDGLEGTLICICLFFFVKWVSTFINKKPRALSATHITTASETTAQEFLPGGRGILTIDSVFTTRESGRFNTSQNEGSNDVVYSNIVEPERLKKTLELYNRFDVIPRKRVTVVEGEEYFDCQMPSSLEYENENRKPSKQSITDDKILIEDPKKFKTQKSFDQTQKRNAFYSSKYLILDSKEGEIPKYLETRPSVSSTPETPKEKPTNFLPDIPGLEINEIVNKWLNSNSENMRKSDKRESRGLTEDEKKSEDLRIPKDPQPDTKDNIVKIDPDESAVSANFQKLEKNLEKTETTIPEIVIQDENDKIYITTIASKLEEKMENKISPATEEETTASSLEQSKQLPQNAKEPSQPPHVEEPQHPAVTLSGKCLSYSELQEFRKKGDLTKFSPPVGKNSFESTFSAPNSLINTNEIFPSRKNSKTDREISQEKENTSPPIEQPKDNSQKQAENLTNSTTLISQSDENTIDEINSQRDATESSDSEFNSKRRKTSTRIDQEEKQSENMNKEQINLPDVPNLENDDIVNIWLKVSADDMRKTDNNKSGFRDPTAEEMKTSKSQKLDSANEETEAEHSHSEHTLIVDSPNCKPLDPQERTCDTKEEETDCVIKIHLEDDNQLKSDSGSEDIKEYIPRTDSDVNIVATNLEDEKKLENLIPGETIETDSKSPHQLEPPQEEVIKPDCNLENSKNGLNLMEKTELIPTTTPEEITEQPKPVEANQSQQDVTVPTQLTEINDKPQTTISGKYLSYSELLEYRKSRDSTTQSSSNSKPGITENIFSVLSSLVNIGGSFFTSKKNSETAEVKPLQELITNPLPDSNLSFVEPSKSSYPTKEKNISTEPMTDQRKLYSDSISSSSSEELNTEDIKLYSEYQNREANRKNYVKQVEHLPSKQSEKILSESKNLISRPDNERFNKVSFQRPQIEPSESSDSEFSIERRKTSEESFSLENYCSRVTAAHTAITTRQNHLRFNHSTKISSA